MNFSPSTLDGVKAVLIEALGIEIVPLTIRFGSEEFVDRVELSPDAFWERLERSDTLPETAAPSGCAAAKRQTAIPPLRMPA